MGSSSNALISRKAREAANQRRLLMLRRITKRRNIEIAFVVQVTLFVGLIGSFFALVLLMEKSTREKEQYEIFKATSQDFIDLFAKGCHHLSFGNGTKITAEFSDERCDDKKLEEEQRFLYRVLPVTHADECRLKKHPDCISYFDTTTCFTYAGGVEKADALTMASEEFRVADEYGYKANGKVYYALDLHRVMNRLKGETVHLDVLIVD